MPTAGNSRKRQRRSLAGQDDDGRGRQQEPNYLEMVKHFSQGHRYPVSKFEKKFYNTIPIRDKGKKENGRLSG